MKRVFILVLTGMIYSATLTSQTKYSAVNEKSTSSWLGEKVIGQHAGTINLKSGWLNWHDNKITSGEFIIDMGSIKDNDGSEKLESHLKSDDFFGVAKFPTSKIVITGSTPFDKGTGTVKGELTIKGITHPVEFRTTMQKTEDGLWFFTNIIVDRSKYDVRYGSGSFFDNLGDKTIYDEFKLKVNLLVRQAG